MAPQRVMLDSFYKDLAYLYAGCEINHQKPVHFNFDRSTLASAIVSASLIFIESAHVALMMKVRLNKEERSQKDKHYG